MLRVHSLRGLPSRLHNISIGEAESILKLTILMGVYDVGEEFYQLNPPRVRLYEMIFTFLFEMGFGHPFYFDIM